MQRLGSGSAKATVVTENKASVRNRHSFMAGHRLFLSDFPHCRRLLHHQV